MAVSSASYHGPVRKTRPSVNSCSKERFTGSPCGTSVTTTVNSLIAIPSLKARWCSRRAIDSGGFTVPTRRNLTWLRAAAAWSGQSKNSASYRPSSGHRVLGDGTGPRSRIRFRRSWTTTIAQRSLSSRSANANTRRTGNAAVGDRARIPSMSARLTSRLDLDYTLDAESITRERQADGIFPLVTNDAQLSALMVLQAYKGQPHIEKRFAQLKTDFAVAPVFRFSIKSAGYLFLAIRTDPRRVGENG